MYKKYDWERWKSIEAAQSWVSDNNVYTNTALIAPNFVLHPTISEVGAAMETLRKANVLD